MRHDIVNEDYLDRQMARARLHHLALTDRPEAEPARRIAGDGPRAMATSELDEIAKLVPSATKRGRRRAERQAAA